MYRCTHYSYPCTALTKLTLRLCAIHVRGRSPPKDRAPWITRITRWIAFSCSYFIFQISNIFWEIRKTNLPF